jgi:hypothetical protein
LSVGIKMVVEGIKCSRNKREWNIFSVGIKVVVEGIKCSRNKSEWNILSVGIKVVVVEGIKRKGNNSAGNIV